MYEIIIAILIIILFLIHLRNEKRIDLLLDSQAEFYIAYTEYVKAVAEHNTIVHDCLSKLEDKSVTDYYAVTSLANHVSYLEKIIHDIEEKYNALQR